MACEPLHFTNLGEMVTRNAEHHPDTTAVIDEATSLTWSALNDRANRLSHALLAQGVSKGDRIAFLIQNSHHWIEITCAALKIGAVLVPLNYRMAAPELKSIMDYCRTDTLIFSESFSGLFTQLKTLDVAPSRAIRIGPSHTGHTSYEALIHDLSSKDPESRVSGEDLAYISFTSGTTGVPKGVMWSHRTLLNTIPENPFDYKTCFRCRQLLLAPNFVAGAHIQLLNGIYHASTLIIMDFQPSYVMKAIEKYRPAIMACAAVMLRMLADLPDARNYDTSSVRLIYYGGASFASLEEFEKVKEIFPCDFQQGYGSAETCILVSRLSPFDHVGLENPEKAVRLKSAGVPVSGAQVKILGPDGNEVAPGIQVGEIAVKASWLMDGYWNNTIQTEKVFTADGYYLTGDMASVGKDGYIFIVDRKDDMVKTGGLNVYPNEVESVLALHPAVEEVAVIGIPDPKWGAAVTAVIRTTESTHPSDKELRDFCKKYIASYKIPKRFFFTDVPLPRSPLGKIRRGELREAYARPASTPSGGRIPSMGEGLSGTRDDPLKYCRGCEFRDACEKFCYKYFQ